MSEGKRITFADIKRQMELASEDIETWPTWMRRAAGLDGEGPDYNTLRAENQRLKEALEQIAKWDKRSQSKTAQSFAKAALQPERGEG